MTFIKKLILSTILILGVTAAGFAQEIEPVEVKPTFHVSDALQPYVATYIKAMASDGWILSDLFSKEFVVIFSHEVGDDDFPAAGMALGMFDDSRVFVVINTETWLEIEDFEKQDLVNHELMHDIFDFEHREDDEEHLMHPSSYPSNWGETMIRLVEAISDLNAYYNE